MSTGEGNDALEESKEEKGVEGRKKVVCYVCTERTIFASHCSCMARVLLHRKASRRRAARSISPFGAMAPAHQRQIDRQIDK